MKMNRVLIADDNQRVRQGVRALLLSETTYEICGEAADGHEALRMARELLPDLVILDVSMPGQSGLEVARILRGEVTQAKILIMSHHDAAQLLPHALEAGAHACVDKSRLGSELLASVKNLVGTPQGQQSVNAA